MDLFQRSKLFGIVVIDDIARSGNDIVFLQKRSDRISAAVCHGFHFDIQLCIGMIPDPCAHFFKRQQLRAFIQFSLVQTVIVCLQLRKRHFRDLRICLRLRTVRIQSIGDLVVVAANADAVFRKAQIRDHDAAALFIGKIIARKTLLGRRIAFRHIIAKPRACLYLA